MKRILSILLCLILTAGVLTGCGGSAPSDQYAMQENAAADRDYSYSETSPASGSLTTGTELDSTDVTDRKLIRTVHLTAESEDYDSLLPSLNQKLTELGGYIQSRENYNSSRRSCSMILRIPADKLDLFVEHVNENANVTSSTETADDVTLEYVDTAAKITALETEQARLLELLAEADSLDAILKIEERLSEVTYELERYASRLRTLDNLVDYATLYLSIREVEVYTPMEEPTVWQRISTGFSGTLEDLGENITDLFVWVIVESPNLLIFGLVIWLGIVVSRKVRSNRKPRKAKTPPEQPSE